jgi:uncharacterized protein
MRAAARRTNRRAGGLASIATMPPGPDMPGVPDHVIAFALLVLAPLIASRTYRKFLGRIAGAPAVVRLSEYRRTILRQWIACAAVVVFWVAMSRPLPLLGLTLVGGWPAVIGAGASILVLGFLAFQWRTVLQLTGSALDPLRAQIESVKAILPRTPEEYASFRLLAVTAGICEEVLYRGFLIWYLESFVGRWPAVFVGAFGFGMAHFYQGGAGVAKTGIAGLVTGALYVLSGSLLWPMILHAAIDLQGGAIGYRLLRGSEESSHTHAGDDLGAVHPAGERTPE